MYSVTLPTLLSKAVPRTGHWLLLVLCLCTWGPRLQGANWYVSTTGNDSQSGSLSQPLASLDEAISRSAPGDTIFMRGGNYASNEIRVTVSDLTIRSYPGEWAVIEAPLNVEAIASCIWYSEPTVTGGTLENLEIIGGYYYGVSFETNWDWGVPAQDRRGASQITLRNCLVHHTGRDCIKIKPGCDDIQIISCELHHSGVGPANAGNPNAEGIDNVNGDRMLVRNTHIHHTSTTGVYAKGGATGCIIEENLIRETGEAGILLGFYTDAEFFDTQVNPDYFECRQSIAQNNIILHTGGAGIGFYAAEDCQALHNTVVTASTQFHCPLFFSAGDIWISPSLTLNPANKGLVVQNNIFVDEAASTEETVEVRPDAFSGAQTLNHNLYFKTAGIALFDDGINWPAHNLAQWQSTTGWDAQSLESDPLLDSQFHLTATSPALDIALPSGVQFDYDYNPRPSLPDLGADEYGTGPSLVVPPPTGVVGTGSSHSPVGIQNPMQAGAFTVYPNPTTQSIRLQSSSPSPVAWRLYHHSGNLILEGTSEAIDLSSLPSGVYWIEISTSAGRQTQPIILQR